MSGESREANADCTTKLQGYRDVWLDRFFRPASLQDYEEWLWAFMRNGGQPTHYYDYDMPRGFFVAQNNFKTNPLYGSMAVEMIVPKEFRHIGGDLGHCNIYMMKGLVNLGGWIPVYANMKVPGDLQTRVAAFKEQEERRDRAWRRQHLVRDKGQVESWRTFVEERSDRGNGLQEEET